MWQLPNSFTEMPEFLSGSGLFVDIVAVEPDCMIAMLRVFIPANAETMFGPFYVVQREVSHGAQQIRFWILDFFRIFDLAQTNVRFLNNVLNLVRRQYPGHGTPQILA